MKTLMSAACVAVGLTAAMPSMAVNPRDVFVRDFDGDGRADLLWQHPSAGFGAWTMNGLTVAGAGPITAPAGVGGSVVITGDFDGDGRTDLLWRSAKGDRYDVVLMSGLSTGATATLSSDGSGWEAVGTGDFDNDGKADILWKNAAGDFRITFMNGLAARATTLVISGRPELSVAAIADVDGDGRSDIVWNAADGSVHLSTMAGAVALAPRKVLDAGTGWQFVATGDFDGDGHADLLWKHADGRHGLWLMADPLHPAIASLVDAGTGWSVQLVRDFDGDGRSDLLWRHLDGSYGAWLMTGSAPKAYGLLLGAGTGWSVAAADDYDGDGMADLLWRDGAGTYGAWLMNGLQAKSVKTLLAAGSSWETATDIESCDRSQPGSFTIVGSSSATPATGVATVGGTKLVHVQRTPGTCGGAYAVNFSAAFTPLATGNLAGYAPLGSASLAFADGEPGIKSIAVATGTSAGQYNVALTFVTATAGGRATSATGNYALSVVGASGNTTLSYRIAAVNAQQFYFGTTESGSYPPLKPGESIAAAFTYQPTAFTPATISIAQVTNPAQGGATDIEIAISATPGRFPGSEVGADSLCSKRMPYPGTAQTVLYAFDKSPNVYCQLTAGQVYYINVRQVTRNYDGGTLPSCTNSKGCALRIQPQGLN